MNPGVTVCTNYAVTQRGSHDLRVKLVAGSRPIRNMNEKQSTNGNQSEHTHAVGNGVVCFC